MGLAINKAPALIGEARCRGQLQVGSQEEESL